MDNNPIKPSNLYLVKTKKLGDYYVIAKNPTDAQEKVEGDLTKSDYGFSKDREVEIIQLLAKEVLDFPKDKPNFSSGNNLLFADF